MAIEKPNKWVILLPVLAGIVALVLLKQNQGEPLQTTAQEQSSGAGDDSI